MKHLFPEKSHRSILTQLLLRTFLIFFTLITIPSNVLAACNPGNSCNAGNIPCRVSGDAQTYCCGSVAECNTLKSSQGTNTSGGTTARGAYFPEECSGGIETALGCLQYDTKSFTISLLTFLAGTAGAISLVIMLIATVQIMTGGDNSEQVKKGKELFTSAITGLLFIVFSVTLLRIVAGDIIQLEGFK